MRKQIDEYHITGWIARGKQSDIYKGYIPGQDKTYAIKVFSKEFTANQNHVSFLRKSVPQVVRMNHPNLILLHRDGVVQDRYYCVMDYFESTSLLQYLYSHGSMDEAEAIHIILQVALALAHSNVSGIIHGGVAPENILVDERCNTKVLKTGLLQAQRNVHKPLRKRGDIIGNPQFFSPEQVIGSKSLTFASDIFSLGAIFYYLLAGTPPFEGWDDATIVKFIIHENPVPLQCQQPCLEPEVVKVVEKMLRKGPAERYPNFNELIADLHQLQQKFPFRPQPRPSTIFPIKYNYAHICDESDVLFAKIASKTKMVERYQLDKALERQEAWGRSGTKLSLADVLQEFGWINTSQRGEIENLRLQFYKQRNSAIFHKVGYLYSFYDEERQESTKLGVDTLLELDLNEDKWRFLISSIKHLMSCNEANTMIRLAHSCGVLNQSDTERCILLYCNNINRGKYREVGYLLGNKFLLNSRRIAALLRAVRRTQITGRPIEEYIHNNISHSDSVPNFAEE